jgi:predicted unusual protein kinase regulating ubiquinone biosynthesis (AarF/ABC1/UbiB family)
MGEARDLEFPEVARDIESLLYGQPFQVPAQFAFTGRAVGTLSGLATGLAPEFNLVDVALPYAQKFLGLTAEGAGQTIQQILSQLLDTGRTLLTLPGSLERVITKLETGQIEVKLAGNAQNGRSRRGRRRNNGNGNGNAPGIGGFAWALMFAATLVGGIFLMNIHQPTSGWFCLGLAGVTVLGLLLRR